MEPKSGEVISRDRMLYYALGLTAMTFQPNLATLLFIFLGARMAIRTWSFDVLIDRIATVTYYFRNLTMLGLEDRRHTI